MIGSRPLRILITNDDGIHNPGLAALEKAAASFGEVWTVAPDRDRSGVSQTITLAQPLRIQTHGQRRFAVEGGTPTDCVYLALQHVMKDAPPDLVLSGINPGPNLGWDVLYSGTAAGAREAVLQGVPGLALSLVSGGRGYPFDEILEHVATLIQLTIDTPPPPFSFYNANLPNPRVGPIHGVRTTTLGHRFYSKEVVVRQDPRGREYLWIGGHNVSMPD
ncbi:MAG: 5'-nucleotidase, partial [Myxococcota bacterium]